MDVFEEKWVYDFWKLWKIKRVDSQSKKPADLVLQFLR